MRFQALIMLFENFPYVHNWFKSVYMGKERYILWIFYCLEFEKVERKIGIENPFSIQAGFVFLVI